MQQSSLRENVIATIISRFSQDHGKRVEALRDVLLLHATAQSNDEAEQVAAQIPELPAELHRKWATLFAERLLETVPHEQIQDLCQLGEENEATLAMVFLMFMESERMEKQVASDIEELRRIS